MRFSGMKRNARFLLVAAPFLIDALNSSKNSKFHCVFFLSTEMFRYQADSFILCAWQSELGAYWKPQLVYALKLRCCIDKKVAKMQILPEKNSTEFEWKEKNFAPFDALLPANRANAGFVHFMHLELWCLSFRNSVFFFRLVAVIFFFVVASIQHD